MNKKLFSGIKEFIGNIKSLDMRNARDKRLKAIKSLIKKANRKIRHEKIRETDM